MAAGILCITHRTFHKVSRHNYLDNHICMASPDPRSSSPHSDIRFLLHIQTKIIIRLIEQIKILLSCTNPVFVIHEIKPDSFPI